MSLPVSDFDALEREAVARLRTRVVDSETWTDGYFLRWLRSKNGDESETLQALQKTAIFRTAWGLNGPLEKIVIDPLQTKHNKFEYPCSDREGNPCVISLFGAQDVKGLTKASNSFNYVIYSLVCLERGFRLCEKVAKKKNVPYTSCTMLMDMEGMTTDHYTLKSWTNSFLTVSALQTEFFPQPYSKIICIKTPTIFTYAYSLGRPFLGADITEVIQVPGESWADEVAKYVDPAVLPTTWGGLIDKPGPQFPSIPVAVAEEDYAEPEEGMEGATELTIYPGAKELVPIGTGLAGEVLRFRYATTGEDVGFGVFEDAGDGEDDLRPAFPSIRLECAQLPVHGAFTLPRDGKYVVEFDNVYSWFSAKEVRYVISIDKS